MQRTKLIVVAAMLGAGLSLGGCATEDYVDKHIAMVNGRIDELTTRVQAVEGAAQQAGQTAQAAMGSAQQANQRLDQLTGRVDSLEQRMTEHEKKPRG